MDGPNLRPSPLTLQSKTLVQNSENRITQRKKAMEKFQKVVFKLAESSPNAPLTPAARNHIQERVNRFVSQYNTPDHPPYSAMIERAISELNEKRGSSEDSISCFLSREYDNLPWAHPAVLKLHLGTLSKSGDIVRTGKKRYRLAGQTEIPVANSQNTQKVERKPPRSKKRLERDKEREKKKRHKKPVLKLKIKFGAKNVEAVVKSPEYDNKEKELTEENGVVSGLDVDLNHHQQSLGQPEIIEPDASSTHQHNQGEEQKPEDLNSRQQPEANFITQQQGIGSFEIMEPDVSSAHTDEQPELKKPEDLNSQLQPEEDFNSQQQGTSLFEIMEPDASSACIYEHSELQKPEDLNCQQQPEENFNSQQQGIGPFVIMGTKASSAHTDEQPELEKHEDLNSPQQPEEDLNCQQQAIGPPEITELEATFRLQPEHSPPEILDLSRSKSGPLGLGSTSAKELLDSERTCRQQRRWNMSHPERKSLAVMTSMEIVTSQNPEENHFLDSNQVSMSVKKDHENNVKSKRGEKYNRKRKRKPGLEESVEAYCEQLRPKPDLPCLPFSLNQEVPAKHGAIFQKEPRRSLRLRFAKCEVTDEANVVIALPSQDSQEKVERHLSKPLNEEPVNEQPTGSASCVEVGKPIVRRVGRRPNKPFPCWAQ